MHPLKLVRRVIADLVASEYVDELRDRAITAETANKLALEDYKILEAQLLETQAELEIFNEKLNVAITKSQSELSFMETERNELNRLLTEAYNEIASLRESVKTKALKSLRKRAKKFAPSNEGE